MKISATVIYLLKRILKKYRAGCSKGEQRYYTCQLFSVKYARGFVATEPEFPKIYRRLPKIAEDFGRPPKIAEIFQQLPKIPKDFTTTSENNRRCRKIFDHFKTGPTIFKGCPTNREH